MHLRSITLKGFKSFPDRTCLEFGPGVSVVVGPNGSGKSNITDAVLWALGEQSPLAVRGQSMQDVIFAGGHGVRSRSAAEVEVVIDNSDRRLDADFSEISISRHLDRSGEGIYRLNGARCRLVDVLEVLSDTGLGKEMHSVISQGRVEAIVHSKPADRTALIEEAAGLTKHRKRRHRAQLKLARTQDNLDRALDVEREARSHLRPLKRQAEAAELHARLERQSLEARSALVAEQLRAVRAELAEADAAAERARSTRDSVESELMEIARSREDAERRFAEHGRERERLSARSFAARAAVDRISLRLESAGRSTEALTERIERSQRALEALRAQAAEPGGELEDGRLAELERELEQLESERAARLDSELAGLESERAEAERRAGELSSQADATAAELESVERDDAQARERRRAAHEQVEEAARARGAVAVRLEEARERARLAREGEGAGSLSAQLAVEGGYEAAVSAVLGGLLRARIVSSLSEAAAAVADAGDEGGRALVRGAGGPGEPAGSPPVPGAERLLERVRAEAELADVVAALLGNAWVVERIDQLPAGFAGIAVTREGVAYEGRLGEVRRLPLAAGGRDLAERNRLAELEAELGHAEEAVEGARSSAQEVEVAVRHTDERREAIESRLRDVRRGQQQAEEEVRRLAWLVEQRRESATGPEDARRTQVAAELAAERRVAERLERERAERAARVEAIERSLHEDRAATPHAERLVETMRATLGAVQAWRDRLDHHLSADEAQGETFAAELRELARREYELQGRLREASEALTHDEVRVAQVRDREQVVASDLTEIGRGLGVELEAAESALEDSERAELEARLERLERRRERLGPVNPLAEREYEDALAHVEELESQRTDLEAALSELRGLIRETDRRIRESFEETFEAAARNFEDVIVRLFPGGSGRLRRVSAPRPKAVLGDAEEDGSSAQPGFAAAPAGEAQDEPATDASVALATGGGSSFDFDTPGIEIEVTPAGKTTKRLSLLSGGEKSLVALAFMFAVFLARPCPFYILDEVEAALDDSNIDRFLTLIASYADRSQFIVITHQRRTMEAADVLYGVSMGSDGVSKVVSRKLEAVPTPEEARAA